MTGPIDADASTPVLLTDAKAQRQQITTDADTQSRTGNVTITDLQITDAGYTLTAERGGVSKSITRKGWREQGHLTPNPAFYLSEIAKALFDDPTFQIAETRGGTA